MTIKKFDVIVTIEKQYTISVDTDVFTEEFMEHFSRYFHKLECIEEHAKYLAESDARFPDQSFIEGYGHVTRAGRTIDFGVKSPFPGADIVLEYEDVDVETN